MGKLQITKSEKNEAKNHTKFSQKVRWNSRTMEWLKIPVKKQKEFKQNLISMEVDFIQYTCYDINQPIYNLCNLFWFTWEIDNDNSNAEFNQKKNLSLVRKNTDKWYAYSLVFHSPWFPPLSIISIEVYNQDKVQLLKTEGKIVFYWAFFVFNEIIREELPEAIQFFKSIEFWAKIKKDLKNKNNQLKQVKPIYKRTRVDIATDVALAISNNKWLTNYIQPHKNSKQAPRMYNYDPVLECFQSIAYIPRLTQGIWIRVYNKIIDIMKKKKQSWHPTYWTNKQPVVTRLELIYSWTFAQDELENLFNYTKHKLLWDEKVKLKTKQQPKSEYSPLSAYEYFKRYAKNHGKTLREVLDDVTTICITEEEKDKYDEINEKYNNINSRYSNNSNYWDIEIFTN